MLFNACKDSASRAQSQIYLEKMEIKEVGNLFTVLLLPPFSKQSLADCRGAAYTRSRFGFCSSIKKFDGKKISASLCLFPASFSSEILKIARYYLQPPRRKLLEKSSQIGTK